ncbi:MAG: winged helix DNA-binding domain-containing protein, partial [Acidobacteriota bacterium]|nr:winged helix DNA-binding domain-containing protein [Acidobacteriota bacterium]
MPPSRSIPAPRVPAAAARRLLLAAQGLGPPPGRATAERLYELVFRLGFVQIDSINVVERAQHLTLAARLPGYRPALLATLLERQRRLFEHWTHDAAAIPTAWFPFWRIRFDRFRARLATHRWWQERLGPEPERLLDRVRERLHREGPLMIRDFAVEAGTGGGSFWAWRPEKAALELLWRTGEVAIDRRRSFHKVYDLTERVLPAAWAAPRPSDEAHLDWACREALARLGVASPE